MPTPEDQEAQTQRKLGGLLLRIEVVLESPTELWSFTSARYIVADNNLESGLNGYSAATKTVFKNESHISRRAKGL